MATTRTISHAEDYWRSMSRSMMPHYQYFGEKNHPYLQGRKVCHVENVRVARGLSLYPEDGGSMFLRNAYVYLPDCTRSILRSHLHSQRTISLLEMDHTKLITIKAVTRWKSCPRKLKSNRPISKYKCNHFTEHTSYKHNQFALYPCNHSVRSITHHIERWQHKRIFSIISLLTDSLRKGGHVWFET